MTESSLAARNSSGNNESKEKKIENIVALLGSIAHELKNYNELVECAKYILNKNYVIKGKIHNLPDTKDYLVFKLGDCENERFCALFLDAADRILAFEVIFIGTINKVVVHPRVLIKKALELNASAVVVVHNHPTGRLEVNEEDRRFTRKLKKILMSVDIKLVDHVIVAEGKAFSFKEKRLIK